MGCKCENNCADQKVQELIEIIDKHKGKKGALIPVLHDAQNLYGYLPLQVQKIISERMNIPLAEIFYHTETCTINLMRL
jgi:NADH:ubiquinone oxidoreductase subunit E